MLRIFRHYVPGTTVLLVAVDLVLVLGTVLASLALVPWIGDAPLWPKVVALGAISLFALYLADCYRPGLRPGRRELAARLVLAVGGAAVATAAVGFAVPALRFGRLAFATMFGLLFAGLFAWRVLWDRLSAARGLTRRVLVLGVSSAAEQLLHLQARGAQPFTILGFLDDDPAAWERLPRGAELLGKSRDLLNLVDELQPDLIVVALPDMRGALPAEDLVECRLRGIPVEDWPTFYEKQTGKILIAGLRPSWLIFSDGFVKTHLTRTVKRLSDLVLALGLLLPALPLMGLIALLIRLDSRGPALFRQERVGQHGRVFVLNKFRTMRVDAERGSGPVWAAPDDPRATRVGRWLRRTRLDELPQLFNVLLGHMSFVGPRPERPEFVRLLAREIPFYGARLAVKPGITGWAQVRHQYAASVDDAREKLQYDLYYIKNLSPFLDLVILLHTVQVVLFARGAR